MTIPLDATLYPLARGSEQVIRANLQQFLWAETLGYLLHPEIPQDVTKVADIATANGVWLCELNAQRIRMQRSMPNLKDYELLDGFDITDESFLPEDQRPPGVALRIQDAREDAPADIRRKYDVVHVRLVTAAVFDGDPSPFIKHCYDILRPGGYLQWEEYRLLDSEIVMHDGSEPSSSSLYQAYKLFLRGPAKNWINDLPDHLQKHGFHVKVTDLAHEPKWHRRTLTHVLCGVIDEIARVKFDVGGPLGEGDRMRAITKAAREENLKGSYGTIPFQAVVAQKPA